MSGRERVSKFFKESTTTVTLNQGQLELVLRVAREFVSEWEDQPDDYVLNRVLELGANFLGERDEIDRLLSSGGAAADIKFLLGKVGQGNGTLVSVPVEGVRKNGEPAWRTKEIVGDEYNEYVARLRRSRHEQ